MKYLFVNFERRKGMKKMTKINEVIMQKKEKKRVEKEGEEESVKK